MKLTIIFYIGWWNECVVYCWRNATVVNNVMVIRDKFLQKSKDCYVSEQCNGTYQGSSLRAPPPRGEASQWIQENIQRTQQLQPGDWNCWFNFCNNCFAKRVTHVPLTNRYLFLSIMNATPIQPSQIAREGSAIILRYAEDGEARLFWLSEAIMITRTRREERDTRLTRSVSRDTTVQPGASRTFM